MIHQWRETSRRLHEIGHRRLLEREYEMRDGSRHKFEVLDGGAVVAVLALTASRMVVLANQFRPGPGRVMSELPGGGVESGESPTDAAARELLEETGFAGFLTCVATTYVSAYDTSLRYHFLATDCYKVADPIETATEQCEPILVSLSELKRRLRAGDVTDIGTAYLGLEYFDNGGVIGPPETSRRASPAVR